MICFLYVLTYVVDKSCFLRGAMLLFQTNPERKLNNDIVSLVFVYVRRNSTCLHTDVKQSKMSFDYLPLHA